MLLQQATSPPAAGGFPVGWDLVVAVVAAIALVQPWIIWALRNYFRKGFPQFYESGKLSVFFLHQGSGLELTGVIKANFQDQFVRTMDIVIVRNDVQSRHTFSWRQFRYPVVDFQGVSKSNFGVAYSMMVATASTEYFDTIFIDLASEQEIEGIREQAKTLWRPYLENKQREAATAAAPLANDDGSVVLANPVQASAPVDVMQAYEEFAQRADVLELKASFDRACYWRAGAYSLTLNVNTDRPSHPFVHTATFQLSDDNVAAIRSNFDAILRWWCGVPNPSWSHETVEVPYKLTRPECRYFGLRCP